MNTLIKSSITGILVLSLSLCGTVCTTLYAKEVHVTGWHGANNYHGHGGGRYYDRGDFFFGWGGPNVIINVPAERYYIPPPPVVCDTVEVCNSFGECWLERRCG